MKQLVNNTINYLENDKIAFSNYVLTFLFAVVCRNFLETLAYGEVGFSDWFAQFHYSAYYVAIFLAIILWVSIISNEKIISTARVFLGLSVVIISCPLVDLSLKYNFGIHQVLGYLSPELHGNYFDNYLRFFGHHIGIKGPSVGYRVEVFLVLLGIGTYVFSKTNSILKSLIGVFVSYNVLYFFCATPFVLKGSGLFKPYAPQLVPYYMILALILFIFAFYKHQKTHFKLLLNDVRFGRMLVFLLVFFAGVVKGLSLGYSLTASDFFIGVFASIAIVFAWIFSVITNNIEDVEIDELSSPNRPSIENKIPLKDYKFYAWMSFALCGIFAAYAHFVVFYFIGLFVFNYAIYSLPPIKLKRFTIISKLPIAANLLLLYMLGGTYTGYGIDEFTYAQIAYALIGGTLGLNFIDLKDFHGDKKAGIQTLPVLIGLQKSKKIFAIIFLLLYILSYVFVEISNTYYLLVGLGILQFLVLWFIQKSDKWVVWIFAATLISVILSYF